MRNLTAELNDWLACGAGEIGEVLVRAADSGWELRHLADVGRSDLQCYHVPEAARDIANLDAAEAFRPLKTAPNLVRGWRLILADVTAVRRALDYLYPAMLGVWLSHRDGSLFAGTLRSTLDRQTGMYRVTQKVTDEQARATVDQFCAGCLKQRLWEIDGPNPVPPRISPHSLPLLCHEPCNLLVAEIRKVVKGQPS